MAQGLRSRTEVASLATLVLLSACGERTEAARSVATADIADDKLVAAVLDECHRPLLGRMQRVAVTASAGERTEMVFAELPGAVRVQNSQRRFLLKNDKVYTFDDDRDVTTADQQLVRQLSTFVDAVAFGPLHRAASCRRIDDTTFDVSTSNGEQWRLQLREDSLLPASLALGEQRVVFEDYLRTATTWIVNRATLAGLGTRDVVFEEAGINWNDDFFTIPTEKKQPGRQRIAAPGSTVEAQTEAPAQTALKAAQWAIIADPGTWPERVTAYRIVHAELQRQNQRLAGFPMFFEENGEQWIAQPFRQRSNGKRFDAPENWNVRTVDAGTQLVVHPSTGNLEQRTKAGITALQNELARLGKRARTPITAQPFVHLHKGEPSAEKLAAPTVRVSVAIE